MTRWVSSLALALLLSVCAVLAQQSVTCRVETVNKDGTMQYVYCGSKSVPGTKGASVTVTTQAITNLITVQPGLGNLEKAMTSALVVAQTKPITVLLATGVYPGNFVFPKGALYTITVAGLDASARPVAGTRVTNAYDGKLPRLTPGSLQQSTLTVNGDNYVFRGIQIDPPGVGYTSVEVSAAEGGVIPKNVTFDQVLIRGNVNTGGHRGIALNAINGIVTNSWIDRMWEVGRDSQAVALWDTPGPARIENNYLEAGTENILLGGSVPTCGCVPTDVVITKNTFTKDLAWRSMSPSPQIKNLFEIKFGRRITVTYNTFQYNWQQAQTGWSILFTTQGVVGTPWTIIEDVTFSHNIVRDISSGLNIAAVIGPVHRVNVDHNVWVNLDRVTYGGDGRFAMIQSGSTGVDDVAIRHNTVIGLTGNQFLYVGDSPLIHNFTMTHTVVEQRDYGIHSSSGLGKLALDAMAPGYVFRDNAIIGPTQSWISYPPGNGQFDVPIAAQFDATFAVLSTSPLASFVTTDGVKVGADATTLPR